MTALGALGYVLPVAVLAVAAGWLAGEALARRSIRSERPGASVVWGSLAPAGIVLLIGSWIVAPAVMAPFGLTGGGGRAMSCLFLAAILAFAVAPLTAALVARRVEHWRGRA